MVCLCFQFTGQKAGREKGGVWVLLFELAQPIRGRVTMSYRIEHRVLANNNKHTIYARKQNTCLSKKSLIVVYRCFPCSVHFSLKENIKNKHVTTH